MVDKFNSNLNDLYSYFEPDYLDEVIVKEQEDNNVPRSQYNFFFEDSEIITISVERQIQNVQNCFANIQSYLEIINAKQTRLASTINVKSFTDISVSDEVSMSAVIYWYSATQLEGDIIQKYLSEIALEASCTISVSINSDKAEVLQDNLAWLYDIKIVAKATDI